MYMKHSLCGLIAAAILVAASGASRAQEERQDPAEAIHHDTRAKMEKQRRESEWQKLKEDTEKLVQAAGELKEMIEKSNKDTFSLEIIKKTEALEKILKEIKRKAREGF
jgi:hypothetical protein